MAKTKNGLLVVDPGDFSVSRTLLTNGSYDWGIIHRLLARLDDQSVVVFVGAHIGALLIPISQRVKRTIGYEADPTNYEFLKTNVALNRVSNTSIDNKAIGECNRRVRIARNTLNPGNTSVDVGEASGDGLVEMTTLDEEIGGEPVDLIVMDIEGYELHAIRGASQTLAAAKYFYVEYAPDQLREFGTEPNDFIDHVSGIYDHMYIFSEPVRCFYDKAWAEYLRNLPPRRGLLVDLLFSNQRLSRESVGESIELSPT